MKNDYETFPDDLRIRYQSSNRFLYKKSAYPPAFSYPYAVIAGILSGKGVLAFADHSKSSILLQKGTVMILPVNCRRHTKSFSPMGVECISAGFLFETRGGVDFLSFLDIPSRLKKPTNERLLKLLSELVSLETGSQNYSKLQKNVSIQRIGYAILECIIMESTLKTEMFKTRRILTAIEYLNENFSVRFDLGLLLKLTGFSRTHFFREFKELTGITPIQYVKRRRLREAFLLLQDNELTIAEIGYMTGWSDPFYFSKTFKSEIGLSPSAYRIQFLENNRL